MKLKKILIGVILGAMTIGMNAFASETAVCDMTMYSTDTIVYFDTNGSVFMPVQSGLGFHVIGITSDGYFKVDLGDGKDYFVPGNGLVNSTADIKINTTASTKKYTAAPGTKDYTNDPNYIKLRDLAEANIAKGKIFDSKLDPEYDTYEQYKVSISGLYDNPVIYTKEEIKHYFDSADYVRVPEVGEYTDNYTYEIVRAIVRDLEYQYPYECFGAVRAIAENGEYYPKKSYHCGMSVGPTIDRRPMYLWISVCYR